MNAHHYEKTCMRRAMRLAAIGLSFAMTVSAGAQNVAIEPQVDPLMDVEGGYASTHVLVRVRPGVSVMHLADGRVTLAPPVVSGPTKSKGVGASMMLAVRSAQQSRRVADAIAQFNGQLVPCADLESFVNQDLARQLGIDHYYRVNVPAGSRTKELAAQLATASDLVESAGVDCIGGLAEFIPDDSFFASHLWGLKNTGQNISGSVGVVGADINATRAWDITTGSPDLVVAVLDSGLSNHVDLAGRTLPGWNLVENNSNTANTCQSDHGTHVAGTIGANGNNAQGVAGVDWNVKIRPYRIVSPCTGSSATCADAITMAVNDGADVISMSLQYNPVGTALDYLHTAVLYAYGLDVPMIAAAGNNGFTGGVAWPARFDEPIAVAAITNQNVRWSGSNQGPQLDVCAPGHNVYSLALTSSYVYNSGTSMATPHVTGTVCLLKAFDPTLSTEEIRTILTSTAVDIDVAGFDNNTGHGRINAFAALIAAGAQRPGDVNGDGLVGIADLLAVIGAWGPCPAEPTPCPADFDGNGNVGISDLLVVIRHWG